MRTESYLLGIDIGGTKCAVVLGTSEGQVLEKIRFDTLADQRGPYPVLEQIDQAIGSLTRSLPQNTLKAIGISCGGPLDSHTGRILSPPNLPGWDEIPITAYFGNRWDVPVALQNDANACALAEWKYGAGKGTRHMVFLTFGTGMGAGLILNGQLYTGANDLAGEVGHLRLDAEGPVGFGKQGSFEGFCSGGGIARLAVMRVRHARQEGRLSALMGITPAEEHAITAKDVFEACEAGDALAHEIVTTVGQRLGQGLALLIDLLNPECIVIGSIYERSGHLLKAHMDEVLHQEALSAALERCRIVPAALGDQIGDIAALAVAGSIHGR
jgi:glucokinase